MEHEGHRRRMRERYRAQGLDAFAPHEILELILFYAIPQRNVNPLAHGLMQRFGSLHGVLDAPPEQLMQVPGVGEYAATLLSLFSQVSKQVEISRAGKMEMIRNREDAEEHCKRLLAGCNRERFYVVCMNGQMEVIADALVAQGSLTEVPAYPRLVVQAALNHNAHSVLLCHNHPGGTLVPSQADLDATAAIAGLMEGIEVVLADHIIVAQGQALSMVSFHLMEQDMRAGGVTTRVASSVGEVRIKAELQKRGLLSQTKNTEEV